jgi:hypothetical protein
MDPYRLFVYSDDGRLIGTGTVIHAANDAEAIVQAEAMCGAFAAELLDVEALRIVKYLPCGGSRPSSPGTWTGAPLPAFLVGDNRATYRPGCSSHYPQHKVLLAPPQHC